MAQRRPMKVYTRNGDQGETVLPDGTRVPKDVARLEACGTLDELNAAIGLARTEGLADAIDQVLTRIQHDLFAVGAEVCGCPKGQAAAPLGPEQIAALEAAIDRFQRGIEPVTEFILPGGTAAAAALHLARTICRRAERRVVTCARSSPANASPAILAYLNRLGDLLFVLARVVNAQAGRSEQRWRQAGP